MKNNEFYRNVANLTCMITVRQAITRDLIKDKDRHGLIDWHNARIDEMRDVQQTVGEKVAALAKAKEERTEDYEVLKAFILNGHVAALDALLGTGSIRKQHLPEVSHELVQMAVEFGRLKDLIPANGGCEVAVPKRV